MKRPKENGRAVSAEACTSDLIDCGRASRETRGMPNLPLFELGIPPYDRVFVGGEDEPS